VKEGVLWPFEELHIKVLIDHHTTSRNNPEANGLAKRVV
jgi:hypothetical protein